MSSRDENPPTSSGSVVDVDNLAVEGPSDIRSSDSGLECQRRVLPRQPLRSLPAPESRLRLVQARVVKMARRGDRDPVSQLAPRDVMRDAVRLEHRRCLRFRELLSGDRRLDGVLVHRGDLLADDIAIAMRSR